MSPRFPRTSRLRSRGEFAVVQDQGRRVATKYLTVLGRPNTCDHDRLGIIASRRLGGAVTRNRAKRRLREVFRRQGSNVTSAPSSVRSLDLVAIPRPELVSAPFALVAADFLAAVRKLRGGK